MMKLWMIWRYMSDGRKYLSTTYILAVVGVALGVTALVFAMAVVSGYETTLRQSVIRMHGHLVISKRGGLEDNILETLQKVQQSTPELKAITPYVQLEGLLVHNKKLTGVALEGIEPETVGQVLEIDKVISDGQFDLKPQEGVPVALIGKGIAQKFSLKVGDEFRLVVPMTKSNSSVGFRSKVQKFKVTGVLDLGRTDYDERYIISDLTTVQKFGDLGHRFSGWRATLQKFEDASMVARRLEAEMGFPFWFRSWDESNANLFQAVRYEKAIIFIIVMLMVVAAAFNVSSTLFLSVVRRYSQIGILKAMGVSQKFIANLFVAQGLAIGFVGATFGLIFGLLACQIFLWAEKTWGLFPGEVYKLDYVELEVRMLDLIIILSSTMIICFLATRAPAKKGAKLSPVDGLRYE